jgi:Fic family protein
LLVRDEAAKSSAIEGTQTTLDELLSAEAVLEEAEGRGEWQAAKDELATIHSHANALERYLANPRPIDIATISGLHRAAFTDAEDFRDTRKGRPGEWRARTVWIGGRGDISRSTYNPPPHSMVPGLLAEHVAWLQKTAPGPTSLATPIRLALAHAHFEAIHPFVEGNGRVGRMLLSLMLAEEGHVPVALSRVIEANRPRYYDALRAAQQQLDFVPLALLMCEAIQISAEAAHDLDRRLGELAGLWRDPARWPNRRLPRRGGVAARLVDFLPFQPVVTVGLVQTRFGVSRQAANEGVASAREAGILIERTGYLRNRVFVAPEALTAIVGGEA